MVLDFAQLVVNGILLGGIYALISIGLTLTWGVMNVINFAHGEYLMIGMYGTFWLFQLYGIDPYISLLIVTPFLFILGVLTQRIVIKPILEAPHVAQIFATIGLSIVLQNLALFLMKADYRSVRVATSKGSLIFHGLIISFPRLMAFAIVFAMVIALFLFLKKTRIGIALRATANNKQVAQLMGINVDHIYYLAMAIGTFLVGIAGGILAPMYSVFPTVGNYFVITAFVVVVLGGMGSIAGALIGGVIIGIVEAFSGFYIAIALKEVIYYLVFIMILVFRPTGLLGKASR